MTWGSGEIRMTRLAEDRGEIRVARVLSKICMTGDFSDMYINEKFVPQETLR